MRLTGLAVLSGMLCGMLKSSPALTRRSWRLVKLGSLRARLTRADLCACGARRGVRMMACITARHAHAAKTAHAWMMWVRDDDDEGRGTAGTAGGTRHHRHRKGPWSMGRIPSGRCKTCQAAPQTRTQRALGGGGGRMAVMGQALTACVCGLTSMAALSPSTVLGPSSSAIFLSSEACSSTSGLLEEALLALALALLALPTVLAEVEVAATDVSATPAPAQGRPRHDIHDPHALHAAASNANAHSHWWSHC